MSGLWKANSARVQRRGGGWCPGGTPTIQTRHIPAGGMCPGGILRRARRTGSARAGPASPR
ncbi:MAG: hypothetical protein ACF8LL_00300 [Phycisphaerales bacterium]